MNTQSLTLRLQNTLIELEQSSNYSGWGGGVQGGEEEEDDGKGKVDEAAETAEQVIGSWGKCRALRPVFKGRKRE